MINKVKALFGELADNILEPVKVWEDHEGRPKLLFQFKDSAILRAFEYTIHDLKCTSLFHITIVKCNEIDYDYYCEMTFTAEVSKWFKEMAESSNYQDFQKILYPHYHATACERLMLLYELDFDNPKQFTLHSHILKIRDIFEALAHPYKELPRGIKDTIRVVNDLQEVMKEYDEYVKDTSMGSCVKYRYITNLN